MRSLKTVMTILLFVGLFGGAVAQAQEQPPAAAAESAPAQLTEEEVSAICLNLFADFMSPYCPGASLRDCGSGQAGILRDRIRDWVREGREREWIEAQLVSEFGESILGAPRFKGFGTLAYIAPVLALLIGLGVILAFVRRQKDAPAIRTGDGALELLGDETPSEEFRERVRAELDTRHRS